MKFKALILLSMVWSVINSQEVVRNQLIGGWALKGVLIQRDVVSFSSANVLIEKLLINRRIEQAGIPIPKGDSLAIVLGATFLCEVLDELVIQISSENEIFFIFQKVIDGRKEAKTETLKFTFKGDNILDTTDERGYKNDLKIEKLSPTLLILSGISSARYMKLCFKR